MAGPETAGYLYLGVPAGGAQQPASHEFSLKVAVANGIFLVVFSYLAFVKGLGLIFPLWPSFLGMN